MRLAVFDLDGTLADTSADLIAAANAALEDAGYGAGVLDAERDRAVAFAGGRAMLGVGLRRSGGPADAVDQLYPRLLAFYRDGIDRMTRIYDGVEPALDRLAAAGWALAICTNKPVALAELLLERLGLRHRFAALLGADSLAVRKPDPGHVLGTIAAAGGEPRRSVLVGDSLTDLDAARAASIACVLVGFGPEGDGVARHCPDAVLAHFDDLPDVLGRLVPEGVMTP